MKFARIYLDLDRKGAKSSFLQRLLIQHVFLGFNWHDLEGKKKTCNRNPSATKGDGSSSLYKLESHVAHDISKG